MLAIGSPFHKADKYPEFCIQLAQFPAELVHHLLLFVHPRSIQQKVARRVAPDRQFRRHHQISLFVNCLPAGLKDPLGIAAEVTNQGIDLGQSNAHEPSACGGIGRCAETVEPLLLQQGPQHSRNLGGIVIASGVGAGSARDLQRQ